ncbi:GNAT family N-acetyltransferase (plasmid) [Chromobacterium amazonense]|uniref:GNAT family N-acetyltransferase n=1 Tax=Chromobacterium amazonense TaxID=1382803 RepID=UPI00237D3F9F|nr:GNAT family N-acetyltransferase [Chromobacterium amazonense]MDE1715302.1 GNAT family N-acetyltransferase [Chromobacterium amazonense]
MTTALALPADAHPLRLSHATAAPDLTPEALLPPPASSVDAHIPTQAYEDAPLWREDLSALPPALPNQAASSLTAARLLLAFLLDGTAGDEAPLTVHLPGSHDGDFAWQLWCNLLDLAGEMGLPPLVFRLYHALPQLAEHPPVTRLLADGVWQLADGDPAPQPGRHAALIAHGHYSRRPARVAWCHYGAAWRASVAVCDDGPRWRLEPADAASGAIVALEVGGALQADAPAPLFAAADEQTLAARQQGRADVGVTALPITLFQHADALADAHPDGLLLYLADQAHGSRLPTALPSALDPILPLNAEALARRWPALHLRLNREESALLLCGVLQPGHSPWPLVRQAMPEEACDALDGDAEPSLDALARFGHNPRWLARHFDSLPDATAALRPAWGDALARVWSRSLSGAGYHFDLGCLAMRLGHYGAARAAFLDALRHDAPAGPALHNLALLEMLVGDAALAADVLAALEEVEPNHPKTRKLRRRFDAWRAKLPAEKASADGLRLSPLCLHHARELAWACRRPHDMALTRLPDLSDVEAASAWIAAEEADPNSRLLAILHPDAGLLGFFALRDEDSGERNLCVLVAPEWRERGIARQALALLDGAYRTEVWAGNRRSLRLLSAA